LTNVHFVALRYIIRDIRWVWPLWLLTPGIKKSN